MVDATDGQSFAVLRARRLRGDRVDRCAAGRRRRDRAATSRTCSSLRATFAGRDRSLARTPFRSSERRPLSPHRACASGKNRRPALPGAPLKSQNRARAEWRCRHGVPQRRHGRLCRCHADDLLPERWTGTTAAELSVLVHEMVHHVQNVGGLKYQCPQEREKLAYMAQDRWLGLFGHNLEADFELDAFSLLVKTRCLY